MNISNNDRLVHALVYDEPCAYPDRGHGQSFVRQLPSGLFPRCWSEALQTEDRWHARANVLIEAHRASTIDLEARFLHRVDCCVVARASGGWHSVESLVVDGTPYHSQDDFVERRVELSVNIYDLMARPLTQRFSFADKPSTKRINAVDGRLRGAIIRRQARVQGTIMVSAAPAGDGAWMIVVSVSNDSRVPPSQIQALMAEPCGPAATHQTVALRVMGALNVTLHSEEGRFSSAIHPSAEHRAIVDEARSDGLWPVLIGQPGADDAILCSPVILPDYPQISGDDRDAVGASGNDSRDGPDVTSREAQRLRLMFDERERAMRARARELANTQNPSLRGPVRVWESNARSYAR